MKILKFITLFLAVSLLFSCSKDQEVNDEKCFCIQYKNQQCLKYYQTVNTDPWGNWLKSNMEIEKGVKQFCDSIGVKILSIKIKDTKIREGLILQCECSKTGKIICVKVYDTDASKLKVHNFTNN